MSNDAVSITIMIKALHPHSRQRRLGPHFPGESSGRKTGSGQARERPADSRASEDGHDLVHGQAGLWTGGVAVLGQAVAEAHGTDGAQALFRFISEVRGTRP